MFDHWERIFDFVKTCVKITLTWVSSTILTIALDSCGIRAKSLLLIYLAGMLVNILTTGSLAWSLCAAMVLTFTFNCLFTEPKLTFHTDDLNYVISSVIFMAVAAIMAALMTELQRQMQIANKKTEITVKLNEIGSSFLSLSGHRQIRGYSKASLANLIGKRVTVLLKEGGSKKFSNSMVEWCYRQSVPYGYGECQFLDDNGLYIPIRNREKTCGVITFDCADWALNEKEKIYVDTMISQVTPVIGREPLSREEKESRIQMEQGRLKSTLLRSVSHDLRTPLTGINGSSGLPYENPEVMGASTIRSMLKDICADSERFSSVMENLLDMTKIQEGRLDINKKKEVMDDTVPSAVRLVSKRIGSHTLGTRTPDDILLFFVDGRLFMQVPMNLLGNAFRHSGDSTVVTLSMGMENGDLKFAVTNDGRGLPQDKINRIFDNFFTTAYEKSDRQRGVGLGLAICKAIVKAQRGTIQVHNSSRDGAVFEIRISLEDKKDE